MDEIGKDRRGVTLIGEILLQLAQRENIRRKLADLEAHGGPDLVRRLLDEFERIVDSRHLEIQERMPREGRPVEPAPTNTAPPPDSPAQPPPARPVDTERRKVLASIFTVELSEAKEEKPARVNNPPKAVSEPPLSAQIPSHVKHPIVAPGRIPEKPADEKVIPPGEQAEKPVGAKRGEGNIPPLPEPPVVPPAGKPALEELPLTESTPQAESSPGFSDVHYDVNPHAPGKGAHPRISYELADEDTVYLHAVGQIPLEEKPASVPFMLEEKGIEYKDFAFALDRGGLRFYLSRIAGRSMNVSKTGVLLLNKHESIRVRGTHFGILNDLRAHGVLLPFTFGSVALGKEALYAKIDDHMYEIRDALDEVLSTKWWDLSVYVLDFTMAQMLTPEGAATRRERERRTMGPRSTPTVGRIDIKALERVLGKQKKIAETIHEKLKDLAVRSDVDMIVGLNSGSSGDWKPILKASYEVPLTGIHRFNREVTDLQYHHVQYELMFVLSGDCAEFSFREG